MDKINYSNLVIIIIMKLIIIKLNINIFLKNFQYYYNLKKTNSFIHNIKFQDKIYFNFSLINYSYNFQFNIAKVEYNIVFFDENNTIIIPSYLTLLYKLHIFCHTIDINSNISIKYMANILKNKFYNCIEYININQNIKFGIIINKVNKYIESFTMNFFSSILFEHSNISLNLNEISPLIQIKEFKKIKYMNLTDNYNSFLLKKSYYIAPKFIIKYKLNLKANIWHFTNIYNNYFCLCKYSNHYQCLFKNINTKCKYFLYLYIIDKTRYLYKKTNYLFLDFSSSDTPPCEAYLVFNEMINQNLSAHYMTKREDIYNKYKNLNINLELPILFDAFYINGGFLEKYLDLLLKIKAVIVGAKIYSVNNLFYNIEYITCICLGHGISYFKDFLYKDYYSIKIFNKILLPPSQIIIENAKKYGWKEEQIIKIGLPRWDILCDNENKKIDLNNSNLNHSIFAMFTWRQVKNNQKISKYYLKNIFNLINNKKLYEILSNNNIIFYYSLHHMIEKYKNIFKLNKAISYINQEDILECLSKSNIIISDFSSIIFDAIAMNKPYIIYIPDCHEPFLKAIYSDDYYKLINNIRKGNINFENSFFNVNDLVNKIIYYINNNFEIETKIKQFYKKFKLQGGNNTQKIISHLKNLN